MKWLARWFSPKQPSPPSPSPPRPRAAAAPAPSAAPAPGPAPSLPAEAAEAAAAEPAPRFLPWLLGCSPLTEAPVSADERAALSAIDKVLVLPALPDELLPRAASVIPQLLAMLRQTSLPVAALAQQVQKDVVLTAEVLRLASSPFYRANSEVTDLAKAIQMIGEAGLQTVVARVVLKPIYDAAPGPLSALAGSRLWDHSERLAACTAEVARDTGLAPFDGYIAGLLHDAGWTLALRVIDRAGLSIAAPPSALFADKLERRAHRLFAQAAARWNITPLFAALAADAQHAPLATSTLPLAVALRAAQPRALQELATAAT